MDIMKTRQLIRYSRQKIAGRRGEILLICLVPLGAEIFLLLGEAAVYCIMLYFGSLKPAELFTAGNIEQTIIAVLFGFARIIVMPPLWCAAAMRILEIVENRSDESAMTHMLVSWRFIGKSTAVFLVGRIISALALCFPLIFFAAAFIMLSDGGDWIELILAANTIVLGLISAAIWAGIKISLMSAPFLMAAFPEKGAWRTVFMSFRFMRGRRKMPVYIALFYFLPVITIIPVFYFIPEIAAAYATGISIFMKEDEYYVGTDFHGRLRKSGNAEKISLRKMRRIAG
ncbi:MAG: hypothetical protein K2J26_03375, partial [Ruminococcus sp.]|nr:hypothetical protein [Ruminococcus sp.]